MKCQYCTDLREAFKDSPAHPLLKDIEVEEWTPEHDKIHREAGVELVQLIGKLEIVKTALAMLDVPIDNVNAALGILLKMREIAKPYGLWPEE